MKKLIIFLLTICATISSQSQFRENVNISLFTGAYVAQKNTYNQGSWYGMYIEYMPIKTRAGLNIGLCALASQVNFSSQDSSHHYDGSTTDFGLGLALGQYVEFMTPSYAGYFGASAMLKQSQDLGSGKYVIEPTLINPQHSLGEYAMQQKGKILELTVNINLLKSYGLRENLFNRTQIRLVYQKDLSGHKVSFWNEIPIQESTVWNKAAYTMEWKQSLFQAGQFDLMFEPKLWLAYYHYVGDKSNWLAVGSEFALKIRGRDDFLNLYFLSKKQLGNFEINSNSLQFIFGLNFMPFNMQKNY